MLSRGRLLGIFSMICARTFASFAMQHLPRRTAISPRASSLFGRVPAVGDQIEFADARSFGSWWQPASWGRRLRERVNIIRHPQSEAGYGWRRVSSVSTITFSERSEHGNGVVTVSRSGPWRCLQFNDVEQGIAYYGADGNTASPGVLGFQYLRVMACISMAFRRFQPSPSQRALCIGLGTGALPGFLACSFPALDVEVVELDPLVVRAARESLLCEFELQSQAGASGEHSESGGESGPYRVVVGDAAAHIRHLAEAQREVDASVSERRRVAMIGAGLGGVTATEVDARLAPVLASGLGTIFLDAFDKEGDTPPHLLQPRFLQECYDSLAPGGVLIANCFNGPDGSPARAAVARLATDLSGIFEQVYTLRVATQEDNVVLVARRAPPKLCRLGRRDLRDAARAAWREAGLRGRDAARLVRDALWVDPGALPTLSEVVPPASTLREVGGDLQMLATRPRGSSACSWMEG